MTNSELHLFILWEHASDILGRSLEELRKSFEIIDVFQVSWTPSKVDQNFSRFYGIKLPADSHKAEHCGRGAFHLIIVRDANPLYEIRQTSSAEELVNVRMFDKKALFREWTSGGHRVHGTNNTQEFFHDAYLVLHSVAKYLDNSATTWDGNLKTLSQDIVGANGWESLADIFKALNHCAEYLVLRNYEELPKIPAGSHPDIDILTRNSKDISFILNAEKVFPESFRVHYRTTVREREVFFDLRDINDGYYDRVWSEKILKNRVLNAAGFYLPDPENHFYSLLYHGLIHKEELADDYKLKLPKLAKELGLELSSEFSIDDSMQLLNKFMSNNTYKYTIPRDHSVVFNKNRGVEAEVSESSELHEAIDFYKDQLAELRDYSAKLEDECAKKQEWILKVEEMLLNRDRSIKELQETVRSLSSEQENKSKRWWF